MDYKCIENKYLKLSGLKIDDKNVTDNEDIKIIDEVFEYDLSIIIPVYNAEKYVQKCIESIIRQKTSYSYEIIFINDGSYDNSLAILKKYELEFSNIIIKSQKNKGASAARNLGIEMSRGRYITFVDADDMISINFIETTMKNAYDNDADMVKTGYKLIDDNDVVIGKFKYNKQVLKGDSINISRIKGHACMSVIKRKIFENLKFPEGFWYEDMIMRFLVAGQCKVIVTLEDCLYLYRQFDLSTSKNKKNKVQYKCLSQYFLLKQILLKYNDMGLKNIGFEDAVLHEITTTMWLRLRYLNIKSRKDIFILTCQIYREYIGKNNKKWIYRFIFENHMFNLWRCVSFILMVKIKLHM